MLILKNPNIRLGFFNQLLIPQNTIYLMKSIILFFTCSLFLIQITQAQEKNTVKDQFQSLYKNSNNYQIYKVVKKQEYLQLQKSILDSISTLKNKIASENQLATQQQKTIEELNTKINSLNETLSASKSKENGIYLFGILLQKTVYNTILWSIILVLITIAAFFIYKFKNSNTLTNEAKESLIEVEQELEQHRKKSLEREQKLRRQLQDEINKQRGV